MIHMLPCLSASPQGRHNFLKILMLGRHLLAYEGAQGTEEAVRDGAACAAVERVEGKEVKELMRPGQDWRVDVVMWWVLAGEWLLLRRRWACLPGFVSKGLTCYDVHYEMIALAK